MNAQQEWQTIGSDAASTSPSSDIGLALNSSGVPYISYRENSTGKIFVRKFNGTSWETVGASGFSSNFPENIGIAIAPDDTPYVGFKDSGNGNKATVMKFDSEEWVAVGSPGFSASQSYYMKFAISSGGIPFIVYRDTNNGGLTAMRYVNSNWVTVGVTGFGPSTVSNLSLAIAPDGTPYVAFTDNTNSDKATVMKFNGTGWVTVGVPEHTAVTMSIKVSPGGAPYIAFSDFSQSHKATVMKFNGANWELVGNAGLSSTIANYVSIAIAPDGTPYVGYQNGNGGSISTPAVMKFDGVNWIPIGTFGWGTGGGYETNLAITSDGSRAIVAYRPSYAFARYYNLTDPAPEQLTAQLASNFCNTTQDFNIPIYAEGVAGASQYRFKVTNGVNVQTLDRNVRYFRLSDLASFGYGNTYQVEVAVFVDGEWSEYGESCNITTPSLPQAQVMAQYCGTTASFTTNIYAEGIQYATAYRFRVVSGADVEVIEKSVRYFRVNEIPGYTYNKTYTVDVAARVNGQWGSYGSACNISTPLAPTSQLANGYCGATMPKVKSIVYANGISQAQRYRFRITDGGNTYELENSARYFALYNVPGNAYGKTYTVEVAVRLAGVWGPYGAACTVSTPNSPTGRPGTDYSVDSIAESKTGAITLTSYPNPYTESFTIEMNTESLEKVTIRAFDMNGRVMEDVTISPEELSSKKLGSGYATGVYNVMIVQGNYIETFKMVKR